MAAAATLEVKPPPTTATPTKHKRKIFRGFRSRSMNRTLPDQLVPTESRVRVDIEAILGNPSAYA